MTCALGLGGTAVAGPKLIPGADATPPRFADPSRGHVRLSYEMGGYTYRAFQSVGGVSFEDGSYVRLDWMQRGKVLASTKCTVEERQGEDVVECAYRDKPLTAKGPIEAALVAHDDADGNDYLLRTYKFTVVHPKSFGDPVWAIVADDLLATAWVRQSEHNVKFRFWTATKPTSPSLRCTVNGTQVPDIDISNDTIDTDLKFAVRKQSGDDVEYAWHYYSPDANSEGSDIRGGLPPAGSKNPDGRIDYLGRYPGAWDCAMLVKGKQIRQLLFTVNDKGWVVADPAQVGPPNFDNVVPIDLRFGKDAMDVRVRPDALKKSRGFGLPWPKPPTKAWPKASGLPDLK